MYEDSTRPTHGEAAFLRAFDPDTVAKSRAKEMDERRDAFDKAFSEKSREV